jgi:ligand-binding sensor domain-containing protein/two-component sensor histidine kinase
MFYRSLTTLQSRATCLLVWLILSTSVALCLDPQKDLRQFGHRSWQTDSGLPQNTVHAILQTRDGYIWLATEGGLVRFDGVQFVTYDKQAPAHLPSATINSLFEDREGNLWIGTDDGLIRRRGSQFVTLSTANGLPSNTIWSTFQDRNGMLWVVTPDGLARYRNGSFEAFPAANGITNPKSVVEAEDGSLWIGTNTGLEHLPGTSLEPCRGTLANGRDCSTPQLPPVQTFAADHDGRIWAGTQTGLYSIEAGAARATGPLPGLPSNEITALATDKHRGLWIGTAKGLAYLKDGALTTYTTHNGLPAERVESIFEDREGATWIATSRGLARVFGGKIESLSSPEILSTELVLSIFEDHEGSLWLGTESGGLEMLHDQKFTSYTTADGLSDDLVRAVFQDHSGGVWAGTAGGGLNRFEGGKFSYLTTAKGLSSDIVLALGGDASDALWVGTPDGLNKIQNGRVSVYTSADGLADDFVRSLYGASDGSLWIGTQRGLSHLQGGRFTSYSSFDGLGSDRVGAITEDGVHAIWIATFGGLTRFDHGRFSTLTTRDGLTNNVITALYPDHEGNLWIGTNQGGLNRLRNGKITAYPPQKSGLPESIYAILEDARGNLWLSSKTGIYSVAKHELDEFAADSSLHITPTAYGTPDGMKISEASSGGHPAAWKLVDGTMWFATLKGIAALDPEHLSRNIVPPPVAIDEVLIDDQPVNDPATGPLTVAPGMRRFEFRYAGMSFIAPQKVRFRYRLDGFDHDWVDAGTRRTAYYTNLPPGSYSFHVLASNNDGVWNETGASLNFRLMPHFYQTLWFYLAIALGLAMLVYAIYHWRLRQVELRYDAVLSERGRIAREIHDTLAQSLVGISVQLELVNRLLASSVDSARTQLDHARNLVRGSLTEARSSIWDLRSQAAETEDFATRLGRMAATATERSDPKIRVNSKVSGTYHPLAPKTEAELLRIAQEAVTNAVRHARPSHIAIELRFSARDLEMTIQDDGCGFDGQPHPQSSGPEGHFGLTGMRERTAEIGGTLEIDSAPGKGTRVTANVPVES